jgi:hypothetical protein
MNETINKILKLGDRPSLSEECYVRRVSAVTLRRVLSVQQAPEEALGKGEAYQNVLFVRDSLTRKLYMLIFVFPYLVKCLAYLATFLSDRPRHLIYYAAPHCVHWLQVPIPT